MQGVKEAEGEGKGGGADTPSKYSRLCSNMKRGREMGRGGSRERGEEKGNGERGE